MTNLHYSPVLGCLRNVVMTMEINAVCVAVLCVNPNSSHNNRVQKVRCCYASFFFFESGFISRARTTRHGSGRIRRIMFRHVTSGKEPTKKLFMGSVRSWGAAVVSRRLPSWPRFCAGTCLLQETKYFFDALSGPFGSKMKMPAGGVTVTRASQVFSFEHDGSFN